MEPSDTHSKCMQVHMEWGNEQRGKVIFLLN